MTLELFGVSLDEEKLDAESSKGGGGPELSVLESFALLQEDALHIARKHGLELKQAAVAAALATAFVVRECAKNIGAEAGFTIAVYGFTEGCETVPPVLSAQSKSPGETKPWYRPW